ncbi:hypothetical protein PVK06_024882 [Gossypium arboreum]|uniref:Cysteine-rich transmembrane domain-containing protein n=1 Tax=Gossypium arboreum TaxID=29729 RepID=A0ABR0PF51_GOSAR|nr:hypothetical protein PVK06_024882 [Gossypium arboreum]
MSRDEVLRLAKRSFDNLFWLHRIPLKDVHISILPNTPQNKKVASQPPSTEAGPYVAPQPAGYPLSKGDDQPYYSQKLVAVETKSRGDGFWKGCAAALCCCCVLDACC